MAFELKVKKRRTKTREVIKRDNFILEKTMAGWTSSEIGTELGYAIHNGQCQRVIQIQNDLVAQGRLQKENGKLVIPTTKVSEHKWEITTSNVAKSVKEFQKTFEYMTDNKRNPSDCRDFLNALTVFFNTLNMHPSEIINSVDEKGEPNYLEKARDAMREFNKRHEAGEIIYNQDTRSKRNKAQGNTTTKNYKMALRMMLLAHNKHLPKLPKSDILSGTKGETSGAYNGVGLTDKQVDLVIDFVEKNGKDILGSRTWDYGYVGIVALMPEMITRSDSLVTWKLSYETTNDEFEKQPVNYDFVKGFFEEKTRKSRPQGWDKFIINPKVRKVLSQLAEYRKGKTLVPFNEMATSTSKNISSRVALLMKHFYIDQGLLPEDALMPVEKRPQSAIFQKGSQQFFLDTMAGYVLRHTGAHMWCRRTNYDYAFVAGLGWTDINTLRDFYAGMDLKQRLKQSDCFYCKPPTNPDIMSNKSFCSATHAFIYYSNGMKSKIQGGQTP